MKKNYISPDTELTLIEPVNMIAASISLDVHTSEQAEEIKDQNEFLSRRHNSVWDEEEEEDQY